MKKYINTAIIYAFAAMVGGVFYREFTRWNGYQGVTALGKVHTHLFLLGMIMFLAAALFAGQGKLIACKKLRAFWIIYNAGVPLTAVMLAVRGITEVLACELPSGLDAAISGVAGIGHILTGIGIVLLLLTIRDSAEGNPVHPGTS